MVSVARFSGRIKKFALFLFIFYLSCHAILFLRAPQARSVGLVKDPARLRSVSLPSTPPNQTTSLIENNTRLNVTPWNITGSDELSYPLNIDMPEVVRCVVEKVPINIQPINKPDFPFLITNADRCQKHKRTFPGPLDLLVLTKSAPDHFLQRDAIRLTWGSTYCWGGRNVVHLFLLADPSNYGNTTRQRLVKEMAVYGDIIQQDFIDHYHNNTYKLLFGIEWAVQFCSEVPLIMFVDDDFFVYPLNVISFVEGLSTALRRRLIAGYLWHNAIPIRSNSRKGNKKWAVSWAEFPNHVYPPYVSAGHFFISMPIARELRIAAWYTKYFRFDDVFLGILMKKLGHAPIHLPQVFAYDQINESSAEHLNIMLSSHYYKDPSSVFALWDRLKCNSFCLVPR